MKDSRWKSARRGSYIVEASIVIPLFIIAVMTLIGILPIIRSCESITYSACEELRLEMAKAAFRSNPAALPVAAEYRMRKEDPEHASVWITGYRYLYNANQTEDLIGLKIRTSYQKGNVLGIYGNVRFRLHIIGRAYTGAYYHGGETGAGEETVYIFPNRGYSYHNAGCTFVRNGARQVYLTDDIRRHYRTCPNCRAKDAGIGAPVFLFHYGEAYHTAECSAVEHICRQVKRSEAIRDGYTPCSKCGG